MVKLIGVVLLIYGVAGVVGTLLIYWWLARPQGPIEELRKRLKELADKLQEGVSLARKGIPLASTVSDILQKTHDELEQVVKDVRWVADRLSGTASLMQNLEDALAAVSIPVLTQSQPVQLPTVSFNASVVTGIDFGKVMVAGIEVMSPNPTVHTDPISLNFAPPPIPTFNFTNQPVLEPANQILGEVRKKIVAAKGDVDRLGNLGDEVTGFTTDAKKADDELIKEILTPLPGQIDEVRASVSEIGKSKLLTIVPLLTLGYLGLIHLAFALTGLALLFV